MVESIYPLMRGQTILRALATEIAFWDIGRYPAGDAIDWGAKIPKLVGMGSIGILIPIRSSMRLLPAHVQTMRPWLELASEIVVVDSGSTDGGVAFLERAMPGARVVQNPPGLYQSWNAGIRQIGAQYTYISTVGDGITRAGLLHLQDVAERHDADVVISPPAFVDAGGQPAANNDWPVHDLIDALAITDEVRFEGLVLFLVAMSYIPFAILGSSASNLYRTTTLRRCPFPTEFGRNGDGAWGLLNALGIRLVLTPRRESNFRLHPPTHLPSEYASPGGDQRMFDAAIALLGNYLENDPAARECAGELRLERLVEAKRTVLQWRGALQTYRERKMPWILDPRAWRARRYRQSSQKRCVQLLHEMLRASPRPEAAAPTPIRLPRQMV